MTAVGVVVRGGAGSELEDLTASIRRGARAVASSAAVAAAARAIENWKSRELVLQIENEETQVLRLYGGNALKDGLVGKPRADDLTLGA